MKKPTLLAVTLLMLGPVWNAHTLADDKVHPAAGVVALTSNEVYSGLGAKINAALAQFNPVLAKAGLRELSRADDDICYAGISDLEPDGTFANYGVIETELAQGKVVYAANSRGTCAYRADDRTDSCKTSDGFAFFLKYTRPDSFLEMATVMEASELDKPNPGPISVFVPCDKVSTDIASRVDLGAAPSTGFYGLMPDSTNVLIAIIARAALTDPRYAILYYETITK